MNTTGESSGGSVSYYKVRIELPTHKEWQPVAYNGECNDFIRALKMNFAIGNIFKATWRIAAANLGLTKKGHAGAIYDLEKIIEFATDELNYLKFIQQLEKKESLTTPSPSDTLAVLQVQEGIENCLRPEVPRNCFAEDFGMCTFPKCCCPNPRTCS